MINAESTKKKRGSEGHREYHRNYVQNQRDKKNDIGDLPKVKKPALRRQMIGSL